MHRILVPNPRACQVCLHCIGFFISYICSHALHSRNHICFIPIFSLIVLGKISTVFDGDDRKSTSDDCFSVLVILNLSP
jgi:hypothetical protein